MRRKTALEFDKEALTNTEELAIEASVFFEQ